VIAGGYLRAVPPALPVSGQVTLTQLRYAAAVDAYRHFGRAAAACHVSQPTLSAQLAKLERTLGLALFDRARSPVEPTEAGRLVVEQARAVLREAARLDEVRDALAGVVAGEVRLGVIPTLAPYVLPALVPALRARHPGLELVVEERVTDDLLTALGAGGLDAALVATAARRGLAERVLFAEPFLGYVSAGHRLAGRTELTPGDLQRDDLWLLEEGHCLRVQAVALCRGRVHPGDGPAAPAAAVRFQSGNLETLARLVEGGAGMTLLPALAVASLRTAAQRALVRPFRAPAPAREVRLVQPRRQRRAALVAALAEVLVDVVRPLLAAWPGGAAAAGDEPVSPPRRPGAGARPAAGSRTRPAAPRP
jgi:LysR family hydrogen peroxide-inducible transcriptional activator